MSSSIVQTTSYYGLPDKQQLLKEFKGRPLNTLRTPSIVIDRHLFANNCSRMHEKAAQWGAGFRAHVKTHKTSEGTRLQLVTAADKTTAVVVSTLPEAWGIVNDGLVADGTVNDILYGLPVAFNKVADLSLLQEQLTLHGAVVRLIIDHPEQVRFLEQFEKQQTTPKKWSIFVKVRNDDTHRAGVLPSSPFFEELMTVVFASPAINLYGFYCHGGNSYKGRSSNEIALVLSAEVEAVNTAAGLALAMLEGAPSSGAAARAPFVLSVGSTPSAHTASAETKAALKSLLHGTLELHAGNYPMLDLQVLVTGTMDPKDISQRVLTTVISYYPGRGENGLDEAMCDVGSIGMSKDDGPSGGYGDMIGKPWRLYKISQEHGVLERTAPPAAGEAPLKLGDVVGIICQHVCLTAAGHPWYYIVDSSVEGGADHVQDIWVPWKGW